MHSNYKRLGDYIRLVDERNRNLEVTTLLGVSVSKEFMPSIANTVGTDFTKYKIVKRNQFTYIADTSRRGDKIGIALLEKYDEALVSQAYTVFEITNEDELLPQYLMMWFRRPEFDRYARFKSHGSVREIFDWEEMCNVELPIPPIEKQREMVAEYQAVERRIRLNNALCQKLEDTAQTLYRHWFEEFEFPVRRHCEERGTSDEAIPQVAEPESSYGEIAALPLAMTGYKSSGGEMVYSEELGKEIPKGWRVGTIEEMKLDISDGNYSSKYPKANEFFPKGIAFIRGTDFNNKFIEYKNLLYISEEKHRELLKGHLKKNDLLMSNRANIGATAYVTHKFVDCNINSQLLRINGGRNYSQFYLGCLFNSTPFKNLLLSASTGSAQLQLPIGNFLKIRMLLPELHVVKCFSMKFSNLLEQFLLRKEQNQKLEELKSLLLGKMAVER